jgi:prolipoprotein diacylglyceryltransferase
MVIWLILHYPLGYGILCRILKEPQGDEFIQFAGLNTGQVLSIPFMLAGFAIMLYSKKNKLKNNFLLLLLNK